MRMPTSDNVTDVELLTFDALSGVGVLVTGRCWLLGVLLWNDDPATAATLDVWDGSDTNGDHLGRMRVAPAVHSALNLPRPGWPIEAGVTVNVPAGTLSGSVLVGRIIR